MLCVVLRLEDFFLFSLLALVITVLVAHLFLRHSLTSRAVVVRTHARTAVIMGRWPW